MSDFLLFSKQDTIATITLNRPELHNAFNDDIILQLTQTIKKIEADDTVRVILLTAAGKNFCAGADLNWMRKMADYSRAENLQDAAQLAGLMQTLYDSSKPIIAAVQGAAFGGGAGLLACCDIVIASTAATFCFSEVKLGLVPAVISPYVIAAIGERQAKRYFLTAEKFDAHEALRMGLVHAITVPEDLVSTSQSIAHTLLQNSPAAIRTTKQLMHAVAKQPINQTIIDTTIQCIADIRTSSEGQEGLKAFLEKRTPNWT